MNIKELNDKVLNLEKKYSTKRNKVLDYYNDLIDVFYEYADSNYNTDYEFEQVFKDIVSGEDCYELVIGAKLNALYFWTVEDGRRVVDEIDYECLADLSRKALKCYDKSKDEDFDIC